MRPFATMRPPGVYPAMVQPERSPLQVADTRTPGFIGIAQKGPIDVPTRVGGWDEFVDLYGRDHRHYLSDSVEAFFRNGGENCYVVRVAHLPRDGAAQSPNHAHWAERVVADGWNKPTVRVHARSEGRWGNNIWISFQHAIGASALLTRDLEVGAGVASVSSTRGFLAGDLVRIYDRDNNDYVILTEVKAEELRWGAATPVARKHAASAPTHVEVVQFDLQLALGDRREVFKGLQLHSSSRRYAPRVVHSESRLIEIEDLGSSSPFPHNLPQEEPLTKLKGGLDGIEAITPEDFIGYDHGPGERAGVLGLVEVEDVALLCAPDAMLFVDREPGPAGERDSQRVQDAMVDLAENLKDRFVILDCPRSKDIDQIKRWRQRTDSSYCAYYWPWLEMPSGDLTRELPPSGVMAGIYSLKDAESGPHLAPANVPIVGAVDLGLRITEDHLGMLTAEGVNSFRVSRGIRPWGARTASSDPAWRYINIRRTFIMLRRSIEAGMRWVPFEPNDAATWSSLQDMVSAFLGDLFRRGMFAGGNPEESYYVKCDEETNPPDSVKLGQLICDVGVAPVSPTEFIVIQVVQEVGSSEE